jgi:hypothetical protein
MNHILFRPKLLPYLLLPLLLTTNAYISLSPSPNTMVKTDDTYGSGDSYIDDWDSSKVTSIELGLTDIGTIYSILVVSNDVRKQRIPVCCQPDKCVGLTDNKLIVPIAAD